MDGLEQQTLVPTTAGIAKNLQMVVIVVHVVVGIIVVVIVA